MAAAEDQSIVKQLDDITECSICSERFTDPRSLPCVHSFCLTCIKLFTRDEQPGTKMPCPMCRKEFTVPNGGVSELPKNFFMMRLMQIQQSASEITPSVCNVCTPDEALGVVAKKATVYCVECREKYCEDCARCHKMFKATSSHKRMKLGNCGDLRINRAEDLCKSSATLCEKHQDQALSIYCRSCKSTICVICYFAEHKLHDCSDIKDVIEKFRDMMTTDVSNLAGVTAKLQGFLSFIEQQKQDFATTVGKAEIEICDKAEENKQLIDHNKRTLLDELATKQLHVVNKFDSLGHEITQHLTLVDTIKKYTEELSKKGEGVDIARETSVLHDRVEELLKLDVIEQLRDEMDSTDVNFTPSALISKDGDNAIGKIDVTVSPKVKKEKPLTVISPDKVDAKKMENVLFEATVDGEPGPSVEWLKDGVKLTPSSRTLMEKNGNVYSLVMKHVVEQDEGQYTVRATNSEGTTDAVATLKVLKPTLTHVISEPNESEAVTGVTSLKYQLFVVRSLAQQQIEVYDTTTFSRQRNISVPGLNKAFGLASCVVNNCILVSECSSNFVFRVELLPSSSTVTKWSVGQCPLGISTNSANSVLVTCHNGHKIQEYTTHGSLIREISLASAGIRLPRFAIELPNGHIAISYNGGVCLVDNNGALKRNHTNTTGASVQFDQLRGLAVARSGCTLAADRDANLLLLLNPSFASPRIFSLPNDCALNCPWSLFLDESRGRLYVGEWDGCRVLVFDNVFNVGTDLQRRR